MQFALGQLLTWQKCYISKQSTIRTILMHKHRCHAYRRVSHQDCFDLAEFNAKAAYFYLMINAPQKLYHAVRQIAYQVACFIQLYSWHLRIGMINKALGSQL